MDVYLKLPGHAGPSIRPGYRQWLPVQSMQFERPLLEKDAAEFTIFKTPDALTGVLTALLATGETLRHVELHRVEGHLPLGRLQFDDVRVHSVCIDGEADLAMERVRFRARRWQAG